MIRSLWSGWSTVPERPTLAAMVPFAGVAMLGLLLVFLPPYDTGRAQPWWAGVLLVVVLGFVVVSVRRPARTWVDPVGPWLFFAVFVLLRDADGGAQSGLAPLVALPICWLVLFGTRRDLLVAACLTVVALAGPLLIVGPPDYPLADWRRALLWWAFALVVAPVMQTVAHDLIRVTRDARLVTAEHEGIWRGATLSSLIATDVNGVITSFSVGSEQLLGYRAEEMVGRYDPGVFHDPDEVVHVAEELGVDPGFGTFAELARRGSPSRIWTYVRKDGERLFVRLAITELRATDGELMGYLGVAIDATEAVSFQRALTRSEERWRTVMDRLADTTVLVMTRDLDIRLVAGAGAMRTGIGDGVGRNLEEISKLDNLAMVRGLVDQALAGVEGRAELNATVTGAEQEVFVTALPPGEGEPPQVLLMARDVSRDRARERELVAARERAERIFADSPVGMALVGGDDVVLAVNPALEGLLERGSDELVGVPVGGMVEGWSEELAHHLARRRHSPSDRVESDLSIATTLGEVRHLHLSSARLVGPVELGEQLLLHVQDVSERRRYEDQLSFMADHDPLTGLANRRRFSAELERHLESCRRYGPRGALLLLDLDHFKEVNDTLGHSAGDELIISVAGLLLGSVRATDVVARLGGDEFALLLPEADRVGAELVAEKIVSTVREEAQRVEGPAGRVTSSVGVVLVDDRNLLAQDLMASADMTMYDAKEAGRDQWAFLDYEQNDGPRIGARMVWNDRLRAAIDRDQLVLHLQPIWSIDQGRISGAEALVRLADGPELVYPNHFIHIAEMSELIHALDGWVLDESVRQLAALQAIQPDFTLEVNVSGKSIGDPGLSERLTAALARHDVQPSGLVLEITETAAISDMRAAQEFTRLVERSGCRSALDDFGAGFGSFYYLKHLHFDLIKIDGEFVQGCHVNPTDRTILRAIVGIAKGLGKRTVAEFVSEPEVLTVLRNEGIDYAQGHLIGPAVPLEEFVERFLQQRAG